MKNFIEDSAEQIMLNSMANVFMSEKLDPVGKEDADIDNDGDSDKSDSYLRKRRQAVGAAIAAEKAKRVKKEEVEATLRQKVGDLTEKKLYPADKATTSDEKELTIEEKPVKNTVKINPDIQEGLKQARKNVGAGKCWDGYVAKGTKKKGGKEVPNCVKEEEQVDEAAATAIKLGLMAGTAIAGTKIGQEAIKKVKGMVSDRNKKFNDAMNRARGVSEEVGVKLPAATDRAAKEQLEKMIPKGEKVHTFGSKLQKANYEPEGELIDEDSAPIPNIPSPVDRRKPSATYIPKNPVPPARDKRPQSGGKDMGRGTPNEYKKGKPTPGSAKGGVPASLSLHTMSFEPEGETISEKAVSRKQQRFMGMVRAAQKGEGAASPEVAKVAASMNKKDVKDFASTKHAKLPEKKSVKEEIAAIAEGTRKPDVEEKGKKVAEYEKEGKYEGITSKFRKEHPGSREEKKERGRKPTEGELNQERIKKTNKRISKYGLTSKEKKESQARSKYDSARD